MIVRTTAEITGTDRDVADPKGNWVSKRIILGGDGVGFSFHETTIEAGSVNEFHYANHVEAVWLVEGTGTLLDRETGETYPLAPGTMYLLNGHERHTVTADTQLRIVQAREEHVLNSLVRRVQVARKMERKQQERDGAR